MDKFGRAHRTRWIAAMTSPKVSSCLHRRAAAFVRTAPVGARAKSSSLSSVAMAARHALLPKDGHLKDRSVNRVAGFRSASAFPVGKLREFRSRALPRGVAQSGIEIDFRRAPTPNFGGHVERLIWHYSGCAPDSAMCNKWRGPKKVMLWSVQAFKRLAQPAK